jgi:hypothetical protein
MSDGKLHGRVEGEGVGMPASSMITKVDGPAAAALSGRPPCRKDHVSLASVSVRMPVCSPRTTSRQRGLGDIDAQAAASAGD